MTYTSADGRVGHDGNVVLVAGGGDAVPEDVGAEHAQLELGGGDLDVLDGLVDGVLVALGDGDALDLAGVDVLLLDGAEGDVKGRAAVPPGDDEDDVEVGDALEAAEDVVKGPADALGGAVGDEPLQVGAALDHEGEPVGVLGVLGEVGLEQVHGVVLGRAVELARVPQGAAGVDGGLEGLDGLVGGHGLGAPGEAHEAVAHGADGVVQKLRHDVDVGSGTLSCRGFLLLL